MSIKQTLVAAAAMLAAGAALADYPEKPITLVVPFAAGGPTDKVARDAGEVLRKGLNNQPVIIENVGGAGGTLGAAKVAKATPDGYTILLHHIAMATSPGLYRSLPYKTKVDPVTSISMARVIAEISDELHIPFGVNVLWDATASIDLAVATEARFVREIFTGVYASDFGLWDTNCG